MEKTETEQKTDEKVSDKELNFRRLEQDRNYHAQKAQEEMEARLRLEEQLERLKTNKPTEDEDEPVSDLYVDEKRLRKFEKKILSEIEKRAEEKAHKIIQEQNKTNLPYRLKSDYSDYLQVVTKENLSKLEELDPETAQDILEEKDEEKKMRRAYRAVKLAGLHKPPELVKKIQDLVDRNARNPFYVSPTASPGPEHAEGNFSEEGKKAAYDRMQALKQRIMGR